MTFFDSMKSFLPLGGLATISILACKPPTVVRPAPLAGSLIEYDSLVATRESGPHNGRGETTAFSFFRNENGLSMVFRKRALHAGSAIGYHRNDEDEIYYVLSGRGELTLNSERRIVGAGTAVLTRAGDSHGLRQVGVEDLVIIITYPRSTSSQR
jgi:mannose-6-phosphate isomerase-like protein (cupin superfamily)